MFLFFLITKITLGGQKWLMKSYHIAHPYFQQTKPFVWDVTTTKATNSNTETKMRKGALMVLYEGEEPSYWSEISLCWAKGTSLRSVQRNFLRMNSKGENTHTDLSLTIIRRWLGRLPLCPVGNSWLIEEWEMDEMFPMHESRSSEGNEAGDF